MARFSARITDVQFNDDLMSALREIVKADEAGSISVLRAKVAKAIELSLE